MSGKSRLVIAISVIWLLVFSVLYIVVDPSTNVKWGGYFVIGVIPSILLPLVWWVYQGFKDKSMNN